MANPRIVVNPFPRNEHRMRRNTNSTQWVTAGSSNIARKNVDVETQASKCIGQESVSSTDIKDVSPRVPLMRDETRLVPPKSTALRTNVLHRDTPLSALQLIDFSRLEQTIRESEVNVSSHCLVPIKEPESNINSSWRQQGLYQSHSTNSATSSKQTHVQQQVVESSTPLYRAAKEIYHLGPKGEGQKVWEAYQQARNHRPAGGELIQEVPSQLMVDEGNIELPPRPVPTSPDGVLFPPLRPQPPQTGGKGIESGSPDLRRDSGFSTLIYEVPVANDKKVQRIVDTNKPLPPVPQIHAAPKVRQTKDRTSGDSRQCTEKETTHTWWKNLPCKAPQSLKSKISHPGPLMISGEGITVNIAAECGGVGGPAAAVSLPITRTGGSLPQPPSNHGKRKEGGRPSPRAFHLPTLHLSPSKRIGKGNEREKVEGSEDSHAIHWRDKLVYPAYEAGKSLKQSVMETLDGVHVGRKKKKTSDISFACQGIADENLDRYQVSEQSSGDDDDDDEGMVPDPLFYIKNIGLDR